MTNWSKNNKRKVMQSSLNSFFSSSSSGEGSHPSSLLEYRTIRAEAPLIISPCPEGSVKIAAFDLDGTLITTKSGRMYSKDATDWKFVFPRSVIAAKFHQLKADGYKIVVFTNQKGISLGKCCVRQFTEKVLFVCRTFGDSIPIHVFASTHDDRYRKPQTGLWDILHSYNEGCKPDPEQSFYVGDAAGRPANPPHRKKKDFSCSDRRFALNVGVRFFTPEEYFIGRPKEEYVLGFNPSTYLSSSTDSSSISFPSHQEIVVFVGFPASGKSSLYKSVFQSKGYEYVNQDTLKTKAKCLSHLLSAINSGQSVVIDNTNASKETRKTWIEQAQKHNIPVRCVWVDSSEALAQHLNKVRSIHAGVPRIPTLVYNMYKKNFEEPSVSEGFAQVEVVSFIPKFSDEEHAKVFKTFL